jgi:uncharacterized protein YprB with RNaseH-like and TPR domain
MIPSDKYAHIAALRPVRRREPAPALAVEPAAERDPLGRLLGAQIRRNRYGEHLSLRRWYATPELFQPQAGSLSLLLPAAAQPTRALLESASDPRQWLFLDTETTGLAGGTGTYAFLVGLAWWDAHGLQVEQLFMRDLDEEHSLLLELAERMEQRRVLLTFNGKSFDWPLLETRYRMTRAIAASAPRLHLDLLHPARQLWRLRLGSVRLKELERHVLEGADGRLDWTRQDDIDSALIPQMYFDYLRGGPAEPLAGVFHHNQMDLRGLAALAAKIFAMLGGTGAPYSGSEEAPDPLDLYGLSRLVRRRGESARARELCESALRAGLPQPAARLAKRELAQLAKRERDYARATSLWEELRIASGGMGRARKAPGGAIKEAQMALEASIEAAEQLAIYHEHRANQPARAAELTRHALRQLRGARHINRIESMRSRKLEARLERRLARLERRGSADRAGRLLAPPDSSSD